MDRRYIFKICFSIVMIVFGGVHCTFLLDLHRWIFNRRCAFESLVPARADCSHTRWSPCWAAQRSMPTGLLGWHNKCLLGCIHCSTSMMLCVWLWCIYINTFRIIDPLCNSKVLHHSNTSLQHHNGFASTRSLCTLPFLAFGTNIGMLSH